MPKINNIRLVNYRYNDGKRIWLDETLNTRGGKNTLFTLMNGGGKTVLIQGIMQAINPKTDLRKRQWKGFFTEETVPTYVLVEWLLDDGVSYATTGVAFQMQNNKLNYYMFATVYRETAPYDIRHLELTETVGGKLRFTSYKDFLKHLRRHREHAQSNGSPGAVRIFETRRDYHQCLRELRISPEEWSSTMKKINEAEGGMNEVFENSVTTERVLKDLILPQVEQKLIQESDQYDTGNPSSTLFKESHRQLQRLTEERVRMDEKFQSKETLTAFNQLAEQQFLPEKQRYAEQLQDKEDTILKFLQLDQKLTKELTQLETEQVDLELAFTNLSEDYQELEFDQKSYGYHQEVQAASTKQAELQSKEMEHMQAVSAYSEAEYQYNTLYAAHFYQNYLQAEQSRVAKLEALERLRNQDLDLKQQLNTVGGQLHYIFNGEINQLENEKKSLSRRLEDLSIEIESAQDEVSLSQSRVNEQTIQIGTTEQTLRRLEKEIDSFAASYPHWPLVEQDLSLLPQHQTELSKQSQQLTDELNTIQHQQYQTQSDIKEVEKKIQQVMHQRQEVSHTIKRLNDEQSNFLTSKNKLYQVLYFAYQEPLADEDTVYERETHLLHFNELAQELETQQFEAKQKQSNLKSELNRLEKGIAITLPKELLTVLDDHEIAYQTGIEFLKDYPQLQSQAHHSILPHALILAEQDLNHLQTLGVDLKTDFIVPLVNRDQLRDWLDGKVEQTFLSSFGSLNFATHFNADFLDEDYVTQLKHQLREQSKQQEIFILQKGKELKEAQEIISKLNWFELTKEQEESLNGQLVQQTQHYEQLEAQHAQFSADLNQLIDSLQVINEHLKVVESQIQTLSKEVQDSTKWAKLVTEYVELDQTLPEMKNILKLSEDAYEKAKTLSQDLQQHRVDLQGDIQKVGYDIKDLEKQRVIYQTYPPQETQSLKSYLLQSYQELSRKYSEQDIPALEQEIESLWISIQGHQAAYQSVPLEADDYQYLTRVVYGDVLKAEKQKEKRQKEERQAHDTVVRLKVEWENLLSQSEQSLQKIQDVYSKEPRPLQEIQTDFENRQRQLTLQEAHLTGQQVGLDQKRGLIQRHQQLVDRAFDTIDTEEINLLKRSILPSLKQLELDLETLQTDGLFQRLKLVLKQLEQLKNTWQSQLIQGLKPYETHPLFQDLFIALKQLNTQQDRYLLQCCEIISRQVIKNEAMLNKLEKALSQYEDLLTEFIRDCVFHIENIYQEIKSFGKGIKINWKGIDRQLIHLRVPDAVLDISGRLTEYIQETLTVLIDYYQNSRLSEMEQMIVARLNIESLLNLITPIQHYRLNLFKIEIQQDQSAYKPWEDLVVKASGGERFFASFVLSAALLTYARYDRTLRDLSKVGKVLIMDNPFGVVTSPHLLRPVFELAEKLNIQMLCLTGIADINIYDNFELVYALRINDLTSNLANIEPTITKEPEEHLQLFTYFKQNQLF